MSEEKKKVDMIEHEEEKVSDTIEVSKSQLDAILERQTALEKDNEVLKASVSKSKQDLERGKLNSKERKTQATLKLWKGVPVIGWKSDDTTLERSPLTGQIVGESLKATYFLADGSDTGPMEMINMIRVSDFTTVYKVNKYPIIRDIKGYDGRDYLEEELWEIEWENPELSHGVKEIAVRFLNDK
jgi:hypothetical protein